MNNNAIIEALKVQPLTEEEKTNRHILGRLYGPIATCKESTRNGRKYNKELWEAALNDPLMAEKIKNKSLFLELGHPLDGREETIMANACACIPELPKIVDGDLIAYVDILDTPNGKILKTLCDYGFVPGISSRGTGDVIGDEVDPNTFQLETWDIVQLPAVESARLSMTESLDTNKLNMRKALTESLNSASAEDKVIMEEGLQNLGIETEETKVDSTPAVAGADTLVESVSTDTVETTTEEANNDGSEEMIKSLEEALKAKADLEAEIKSLQEKLAVSDTKVSKLNEELSKYKTTTIRLSSLASSRKGLEERVSSLEEELKAKNQIIESNDLKIKELTESVAVNDSTSKSLTESISTKDSEIVKLNESLTKQKEDYESKINQLTEDLKKQEESSSSQIKELTESVSTLTQDRDSWKKTANITVNNYIKAKALMLGVEPEEIKNKLSESYTIKDIDNVCDKLQSYALNISKLPISLDRKVKVQIHESKNDKLANQVVNSDDDVSDALLKMAGCR